MAKGQHLSRHQEKIVKRYYEHRDTIRLNKLGDLLGELYLCDSEAKSGKLWKRAEAALRAAAGEDATLLARIDKIAAGRDIEKLGRLVNELSGKR